MELVLVKVLDSLLSPHTHTIRYSCTVVILYFKSEITLFVDLFDFLHFHCDIQLIIMVTEHTLLTKIHIFMNQIAICWTFP